MASIRQRQDAGKYRGLEAVNLFMESADKSRRATYLEDRLGQEEIHTGIQLVLQTPDLTLRICRIEVERRTYMVSCRLPKRRS